MGELSRTYYARLGNVGRRYDEPHKGWTMARCLYALEMWIQDNGRRPKQSDMVAGEGLPSYTMIYNFFGGLSQWYAAHEEASDRGTLYPDYPPEVPALPFVPSKQIGRHHTPDRAGERVERPCLRCDKVWSSPDRRYRWICDACTGLEDTGEDGSWMNGDAVVIGEQDVSGMHCDEPDTKRRHAPAAMQERARKSQAQHAMILSERAKLAAMTADERRAYWRAQYHGKQVQQLIHRHTNHKTRRMAHAD